MSKEVQCHEGRLSKLLGAVCTHGAPRGLQRGSSCPQLLQQLSCPLAFDCMTYFAATFAQ